MASIYFVITLFSMFSLGLLVGYRPERWTRHHKHFCEDCGDKIDLHICADCQARLWGEMKEKP